MNEMMFLYVITGRKEGTDKGRVDKEEELSNCNP